MAERKNQSVVISGESGAGKTVNTKLVLQFVSDVSARLSGKAKVEGEAGIEEQVLQTNPILESQGNAKTLRNNNSSRFGKLITVKFDTQGGVVGASIIDYLLEKSRVTFQAEGERNYHVFYMLIAGCKKEPKLRAALQLADPQDYHYLDQSGVTEAEGFNDEAEYEDMIRSYGTLQYSDAEKQTVFAIFAACLHASNVHFEKVAKAMEEDGSRVANPETLAVVAAMLGLDAGELEKALTSKNVGNKSVIIVSYTPAQSSATRDSMAKAIYQGLFTWTIAKCNASMDKTQDFANFAAILDIFGFESFHHNSLEQLCINLCNEKLQYFFNDFIFAQEEAAYEAEGVSVPRSDFEDNGPTLELLEKPRQGVLAMIDEEISVPRGSDASLLSKLVSKHGPHKNFEKAGPKNCPKEYNRVAFGIVHYAGMVMYDTTDFLEKNKDQLHPDVVTMLHTTTSDLVKTCLPPPPVKGGSKKKSATLCSAFKKSLAELIATLQTTEPHFVRCMKPNKEKIGGNFTSAMMLEQMRYSGLLEVCRIRKLGYPLRKDYKDFAKRYGTIVRGTKSVDELLKGLEEKGVLKAGMWAKGTTKIFMKAPQSVDLEVAREDSLLETAVICQKYARRYVMKVKMKTWKKELDLLKGAIAKRTEEALEEALNNTSELPGNGKHLQIVKDASALLVRIQEEKRVVAFLSKAIEKHDKSLLVQAIESAEKMDFAPPELGAAREALSKIKQEEALIAALKDCVAARDRSALDAKLGECADFGIPDDNEVVAQAQALSHRLAEDRAECNRWFGWS